MAPAEIDFLVDGCTRGDIPDYQIAAWLMAAVLRGKSGTIAGVNTLSGVIDRGHGRYRFFSIMINHHLAAGSDAIEAIDSIVMALAGPE